MALISVVECIYQDRIEEAAIHEKAQELLGDVDEIINMVLQLQEPIAQIIVDNNRNSEKCGAEILELISLELVKYVKKYHLHESLEDSV